MQVEKITFRQEAGRQPTADAQFLRKQLLKFVSREIARRQKLGLPLGHSYGDRLDFIEIDLQMWRLHEDWDPKNPKHSLKAEIPDFAEAMADFAQLKEKRRQARIERRRLKREAPSDKI